MNWRGRLLEDYETVVKLIGATTTSTGLKVPKATIELQLHRLDFHSE
jgi:Rhodopirellula transposase DDE domain